MTTDEVEKLIGSSSCKTCQLDPVPTWLVKDMKALLSPFITAVTKVCNDLLLAADQGDVSALCLLDLTAAFDTVDHDLMMLRLERQFGLRGVVLQWFS